MTKDTIIILLIALLALSLMIHVIVLALYLKCRENKRTEKSTERSVGTESFANASEISEELLLVLLTAAASTVLAKDKKSQFRVISFRRADQDKKKGL